MATTWNVISQFSNTNPPRHTIKRSKDSDSKYKKLKLELVERNISIGNYIKEKLFSDNSEYALVKNDFPYMLDKNVLHYVFWINPKFNEKYNDNTVEKILKNSIDFEFIYFKNIIANKSVLDVEHYQVFIHAI